MKSIIIIKKFLIAIALLCGGAVVGGCTTHGFDTRSYESLKAQTSTMHRGIVALVAPDDKYQKLLAAYKGDSEKFRKGFGLTLEEAQDKQLVMVDRWRIPGGGRVKACSPKNILV